MKALLTYLACFGFGVIDFPFWAVATACGMVALYLQAWAWAQHWSAPPVVPSPPPPPPPSLDITDLLPEFLEILESLCRKPRTPDDRLVQLTRGEIDRYMIVVHGSETRASQRTLQLTALRQLRLIDYSAKDEKYAVTRAGREAVERRAEK